MRKPIKKSSGFTMTELIVSVGLVILIFAGGYIALNTFMKGGISLSAESKTNKKLHNIAESIRYQAATEFDNNSFTRNNELRNEQYDRQIMVWQTIDPIDVQSQTRKVTLIAKRQIERGAWFDGTNGNVRTTTMTFTISRFREKISGGTIKIRIVKKNNTSQGFQGLHIWASGYDIPQVIGRTDENGFCTVPGLSTGNIKVMLDGTFMRAYFEPIPSITTVNSFIATVPVANLEIGKPRDLGTFVIVPPGTVKGYVMDAVSNTAVSGVTVRLEGNPANTPFSYMTRDTYYGVTDGTGFFFIEGVLPRNYYWAIKGNGEYVSIDRPGTETTAANRTPTFPVDPDALFDLGNLHTIKKGSFQATVKYSNYDPGTGPAGTGDYKVGALVSNGVKINLLRPAELSSSIGTVAAPTTSDFTNSVTSFAPGTSTPNEVGNAGVITKEWFTPMFINRNIVKDDMDIVWNLIDVFPVSNYADPTIPVMIAQAPKPRSETIFRLWSSEGDRLSMPWNTTQVSFRYPVYTNGFTNSSNSGHNWYFLRRDNSNLANVRGVFSIASPGTYAKKSVRGRDWGYGSPTSVLPGGYVMVGMGGLKKNASNEWILDKNLSVNTTVSGSGPQLHSFTFLNGTDFVLIPNAKGVHTEEQEFSFSATSDPISESKKFRGTIAGVYKSGPPVSGPLVWPAPLNIPGTPPDPSSEAGITLVVKYSEGGSTFTEMEIGPLTVTNGQFTSNWQTVYKRDSWDAKTPPVELLPGMDHNFGTIAVTKTDGKLRDYFLSTKDHVNWRYNPNGFTTGVKFVYTAGDFYEAENNQSISIVRKGKALISGTVYNEANIPIPGAKVKVTGTGFSAVTLTADAAGFYSTDANGIRFSMPPGQNLKLTATSAGYHDSAEIGFEGYHGIVIVQDFNLKLKGTVIQVPVGDPGSG